MATSCGKLPTSRRLDYSGIEVDDRPEAQLNCAVTRAVVVDYDVFVPDSDSDGDDTPPASPARREQTSHLRVTLLPKHDDVILQVT
jgi:hypothetical protein